MNKMSVLLPLKDALIGVILSLLFDSVTVNHVASGVINSFITI